MGCCASQNRGRLCPACWQVICSRLRVDGESDKLIGARVILSDAMTTDEPEWQAGLAQFVGITWSREDLGAWFETGECFVICRMDCSDQSVPP